MPITTEHAEKLHEGIRKKWQNPKFRRKMSQVTRKLWRNSEFREKILTAMQGEDRKKKIGEASKRHWQQVEYREKVLKTRHERKHLRKKTDPEIARCNGRKMRCHTQEAKNKISEASRQHWQDQRYRERVLSSLRMTTSKGGKAAWSEENREKTLRAILKGLFKRPTSYEERFIELCKKHNLSFKYVGDGSFLIAGRNPDFMECNGKKILVETYDSFWHPKNYQEKRASLFAKYGFKTIFLSEGDLFAHDWEEHCVAKINQEVTNVV